jgi:hypothetical protein
MREFTNSTNPLEAGVRPRKFLSIRAAMLKDEKMHKKVDKDFYPKSHLKSEKKKEELNN